MKRATVVGKDGGVELVTLGDISIMRTWLELHEAQELACEILRLVSREIRGRTPPPPPSEAYRDDRMGPEEITGVGMAGRVR